MERFVLSTIEYIDRFFPEKTDCEKVFQTSKSILNFGEYDANRVKHVLDQMCKVAGQPTKLADYHWEVSTPAEDAATFLIMLVKEIDQCELEEVKRDPVCIMRLGMLFGQFIAGLSGSDLIQGKELHNIAMEQAIAVAQEQRDDFIAQNMVGVVPNISKEKRNFSSDQQGASDLFEFLDAVRKHLDKVIKPVEQANVPTLLPLAPQLKGIGFTEEERIAIFHQMCQITEKPIALAEKYLHGEDAALDTATFIVHLVMEVHDYGMMDVNTELACRYWVSVYYGMITSELAGEKILQNGKELIRLSEEALKRMEKTGCFEEGSTPDDLQEAFAKQYGIAMLTPEMVMDVAEILKGMNPEMREAYLVNLMMFINTNGPIQNKMHLIMVSQMIKANL